MTAEFDVSKGQTDMSYKGELQTLTNLSVKQQGCPDETCCTTISESIITMLISRGRSNCRTELAVRGSIVNSMAGNDHV